MIASLCLHRQIIPSITDAIGRLSTVLEKMCIDCLYLFGGSHNSVSPLIDRV